MKRNKYIIFILIIISFNAYSNDKKFYSYDKYKQNELIIDSTNKNELDSLLKYKYLQTLHIENMDLKDLPEALLNHDNLTKLFFESTKIINGEEIIEKITQSRLSTQLESFGLINMGIDRLSNNMALMRNLNSLSFKNNNLSEIPNTLEALKNLESLDISFNKFIKVPNILKSFKKLKFICLDSNNISAIPHFFSSFKKLEALSLWGVKLNNRDLKLIFSIHSLKSLVLRGCDIAKLPNIPRSKYNLEVISLMDNKIRNLPNSFVNFKLLNNIFLDNNCLNEFPLELCKLKYLRDITLNNNKISNMPNEFNNLAKKLFFLDLRNNNICETEQKRIKSILENTTILFE